MAHYRADIHSPMPIRETFEYMADFSNAAEWDANTVSSECVNGDPLREGAKYEVVTEFGGRNLSLSYETIELDAPDRVLLRSSTALAGIEDEMTFSAASEGTRITYEARIKPKGVARILDPLFGLIFQRVGNHAAESMRETLAGK